MEAHDRIDFICIGAAKAGTTWLFEMLRQHARIWLPDTRSMLNDVCRFIGVPDFVPADVHRVVNATLTIRSWSQHDRIGKMQKTINRFRLSRFISHQIGLPATFARLYRRNLEIPDRVPVLAEDLRAEMAAGFREDLLALCDSFPGTFDDWVV